MAPAARVPRNSRVAWRLASKVITGKRALTGYVILSEAKNQFPCHSAQDSDPSLPRATCVLAPIHVSHSQYGTSLCAAR